MVPIILKLKAGSNYFLRASPGAELARQRQWARVGRAAAFAVGSIVDDGPSPQVGKTLGLSLLDAAARDLVLCADHTMKKQGVCA